VLTVVIALDLFGLGAAGVGLLGAALGAGGILGTPLAVVLVRGKRVARCFCAGVAGWGVPMILLAFTHAQQGSARAIQFMRGFLPGMWSFAVFCFVAALTVVPLGGIGGLLVALAAVMPIQAVALWWMQRREGLVALVAPTDS